MMSLEPISSLSFTCASIASATSPSSTWSALRASLFTCFDRFYNLDWVQQNFCSSKRLLDTVSSFQSNSARTTPLDKIWEWRPTSSPILHRASTWELTTSWPHFYQYSLGCLIIQINFKIGHWKTELDTESKLQTTSSRCRRCQHQLDYLGSRVQHQVQQLRLCSSNDIIGGCSLLKIQHCLGLQIGGHLEALLIVDLNEIE